MPPRLMLAALLVATTAGAARGQPAEGAMLTTISVDQTSIFLQDNNYPSEVLTNRDGSRSLKTKVGEFTTILNFYGCGTGEQCRSFQLRAYFSNPRKRGVDFANRWNRAKRFVKVYVESDRDLVAEMDISVEGGVTRRNLLAALNLYGGVLKQFREEYNR